MYAARYCTSCQLTIPTSTTAATISTIQWTDHCLDSHAPVIVQALQEAKARSDAASAEVQRIHKEVTRLEVAIPKLQLEAAAARQQATDLQHRLAQLSSAAQVISPTHVPDQWDLPLALASKHRLLQHKAASQTCLQIVSQ